MKDQIYIPNSVCEAGRQIRQGLTGPLQRLPKRDFLRVWCSIAYLYPGLHPDGFDAPDSGWPRVLKRFAAEAWRRADSGSLTDSEMYPSDPQWCGLFDRMHVHLPDETQRRVELAATFGEPVNA